MRLLYPLTKQFLLHPSILRAWRAARAAVCGRLKVIVLSARRHKAFVCVWVGHCMERGGACMAGMRWA